MNMRIVILGLLLFTVSCVSVRDSRLSGTYKMDGEATVAYLMTIPPYADEADTNRTLSSLRKGFCRDLRRTWFKNHWLEESGEKWSLDTPYRVIQTSTNTAIVRDMAEQDPHAAYLILEFTDDGYWESRFFCDKAIKIRYRRIQQSAAPLPSAPAAPPDGAR